MNSVRVKLPGNRIVEVVGGTTGLSLAQSLGHDVAKHSVAAIVNGMLADLNTPIIEDASVLLVPADSAEGLQLIRHSTAHLLAQALKRIYGDSQVQLGIGPVIENGFYYDVDVPEPISADDLQKIERVMHQIVSEELPISRQIVSKTEAEQIFRDRGESLKVQLIEGFTDDDVISLYRQGEFLDLCRGPHVPHTGRLGTFKLLSVAGAYWRGDAQNRMLQRIYGTAFSSQHELDEHLRLLDEAKQRDHRKLAKDLELVMFSEDAPGMPFYLKNGLIIRNELEQVERKLQALDYDEVRTPLMMNERLWQQSGHTDHYRENMYFIHADQESFALKPMSCPGHMLIYKHKTRSYRDLPLRLAEYGICHRHELSGAQSGLTRVRAFTQDDAHLFVRPDQIESEIAAVIDLLDEVYSIFGFTYSIELSTRPENALGSLELWESAEEALQSVLKCRNLTYHVNEGDGAFYGPKIDFHIQDALARRWQCGTIQLDFQLPERFDLTYVGADGAQHRPVVIHRAIFGSMERFLGILTEHYGGAFPAWLAPVQVRIVPVSEKFKAHGRDIKRQLIQQGLRVECDERGDKVGFKIRESQRKKIPYTWVIGEKEVTSGTVSIRRYGESTVQERSIQEAVSNLLDEVNGKVEYSTRKLE